MVVVALLLMAAGQWLAAVVVFPVGYAGFFTVFNLRRPWWGEAGQAAAATAPPPRQTTDWRLVGLLVVVTVVTVLLVVALSR
jgi:hypothetical protein